MTAMKFLFGAHALFSLYVVTHATSAYIQPGTWGSWGSYCPCSKSCGGGSQYRLRPCLYAPCKGDAKQTKDCNTQGCKVDGGWSKWSDYSKCTKTCKSGTQFRTRTCTNPKPAHGGKDCAGGASAAKQSRVCNKDVPCPVDGMWSKWSDYSKCTKTCKSGTQFRTRTCTNPKPAHGGKDCVGGASAAKQSRVCNKDVPCPVDGMWSKWSDYSKCTKTCKSGTQFRTRTCTNPKPAHGGKDCAGGASAAKQSRVCNKDVPCPVPGGWSKWSPYSKCTKSCKSGTQSRTRTCTNPKPANGGADCKGSSSQSRACNNDVPCPVPGGWSKWSPYSKCTKSCKSGTQSRTRTCTNPKPANGGADCKGTSSQSRVCNNDVPCPVNIRFYPLNYKNVERGGSVTLIIARSGDLQQSSTVYLSTFDGSAKKNSDYKPRNKLAVTFKSGQKISKAVIGIVNDKKIEPTEKFYAKLTSNNPSVKVVPAGAKATIRIDDDDSQFRFQRLSYAVKETAGKVKIVILRSGATNRKQIARVQTKDGTAVSTANGDFQSVGKPTPLSVVFAAGQKQRTISINIKDDKLCEKKESFKVILSTKDASATVNNAFDVATVYIIDNDVNGGWGKWSSWSKCNKHCGKGKQYRTRKCINPAKQGDGKDCKGRAKQYKYCYVKKYCPVYVGFHPLNYKTVESSGSVKLGIARSGDLQQSSTVYLSTFDGSAKKNSDYKPRVKLAVKFKAGQKISKAVIGLVNDKKIEPTEKFYAKLTSNNPSVKFVPARAKATIRIDDDDSQFRFQRLSYSVKENAGKVKIVILRSGATNRKQIARVQTKDGTAVSTANGDFQSVGKPTPLSVVFAAGQKQRTISINIKDDKLCEKKESFKVILSTKDASATVNNAFDVATVYIIDDDVSGSWGKWSSWSKCNKLCGKGKRYRTRKCVNGRHCVGQAKQYEYCYIKKHCPVNGGYGSWSRWSSCSRTCGGGGRCTRKRYCNNPKPQYSGKPCEGADHQTKSCYVKACPYGGYVPTPPPYKPPAYDDIENQ